MGDVREHPQSNLTARRQAGTPVHVEVYAEGNGKFYHEWRFEGGPKENGKVIDIPEKDKGQPGTPIHFHLYPGKTGLTFSSGTQNVDCTEIYNAIWVSQQTCPTKNPSADPEIKVDHVVDRHLKVTDLNETECLLHYCLRFEPDPDKNYYDPDIKNGGTLR